MLIQQADKAENRQEKPMHLTKQIGQTTYKVNIYFSKTSKETMGDKIIRRIETRRQILKKPP